MAKDKTENVEFDLMTDTDISAKRTEAKRLEAIENALRVLTRYFVEDGCPKFREKYVRDFLSIIEKSTLEDKIEWAKEIVVDEARKHGCFQSES